jgi:hypothetical protein
MRTVQTHVTRQAFGETMSAIYGEIEIEAGGKISGTVQAP